MEDFEQENIRLEIPGLPESEVKGKKGKKKGNNKKTFTLQNFLQDENQEIVDSAENSDADAIESHFAKLNLDDEELIVMESCHSYIHDLLKQLGPTNAMDPLLQQEINNFPPEAKRVMSKCGGYRNFILRSKDLAVVDKIVAAKSDLKNAQEIAFKEIYSNLPSNMNSANKNDNINVEQSKDIWNSKSNINSTNGKGPESRSEFSIFSNEQSGNSLYYQSSNTGQTDGPGVIGNGSSARQHLMKGLTNSSVADKLGNNVDFASKMKIKELEEANRKLTETTNELRKKLQDKETLEEDIFTMKHDYEKLQTLHLNTENDLTGVKAELERREAELAKLRALLPKEEDEMGSSSTVIALMKQLQGEQLKNVNLTKELETMKLLSKGSEANLLLKENKPPGFPGFPVSGGAQGWEQGGMGLSSDRDLLGLRSIGLGESFLPHSSMGGVGSSMFGGLGTQASGSNWGAPGPSQATHQPEFKPRSINKSVSSLGLGLHSAHSSSLASLTSGGLGQGPTKTTSPVLESGFPGLGGPAPERPPASNAFSAPVSQPGVTGGGLYTQPPPLGSLQSKMSQPPVPTNNSGPTGPPSVSSQGSAKTARQELLVKRLMSQLPGNSEETIKNGIMVLRERHGKLSGWPTSKIAEAIGDLLKSKDTGLKDSF